MSNQARNVCVVTGSRADYGLLRWVMNDINVATDLNLQLLVTGTHLSPEFGFTVREIEADGFTVSHRVEITLSSDSPAGVAASMALGVVGVSTAFEKLKPDVVLVLGDRFEILAAAQAAVVHGIPLAHIAGGDTTEGAIDESFRHAITKLAHVHLVTNELSALRVRQMGESPERIHIVGSPGLDQLRRRPLLGKQELEKMLGSKLGVRNVLVTFHPVTLEGDKGTGQAGELLSALESLGSDFRIWFTKSNADAGGRAITELIAVWVAAHSDRASMHQSLGHHGYMSLMANVDVVVGNSSSGFYEAPSLGVPTVNIGNRQEGRLAASSIITCTADRVEIAEAILRATTLDCGSVVNPYGDGYSSARIVEVLRNLPPTIALLRKRFLLLDPTHE